MRLAWATDIHLNFLTTMARRRFLDSVKEQADAMVITGDIAEAVTLHAWYPGCESAEGGWASSARSRRGRSPSVRRKPS